ncbi:MAG: hypothetical protein HZB91_08800 [Elusimicrobia bacterium]|nr:hypothetical protein [Elusimicrobiota bacterium]
MSLVIAFASLAGSIVFFVIAWGARVVDPADPILKQPWQSFTGRYKLIAYSPKGAAYSISCLLLALSFWTAFFRTQHKQAADSLASRVSLFPGATFESGASLPPRFERMWIFQTSGTAREVVSFYSRNASKTGWTVESGGPTALILSRSRERLTILVVEDRGSAKPRNNIIYQLTRKEIP